MKITFYSLLFLLLISCNKNVEHINEENQNPFGDDHSIDISKITEESNKFISENINLLDCPGGIIGVIDKSGIIFSHAFGYADIENNLIPTEKTVFRIGSLSKTFIGLGFSILKNKGVMNEKDYIEKYYKILGNINYPDQNSAKITIEDLFTHSSGVSFMAPLPRTSSLSELVVWLSGSTLGFNPGENFLYSNLGVAILAGAIGIVAKMPFENFINEEVLTPLKMANTVYHEHQLKNLLRSYGYEKTINGYIKLNDPDLVGYAPSGSIYSTLEDLSKYMVFMFNLESDKTLSVDISHENLEKMKEPKYFITPQENTSIGISWFILERDNSTIISHSGSIDGYSSFFQFEKNKKLGLIILVNSRIDEKIKAFGNGLIDNFINL